MEKKWGNWNLRLAKLVFGLLGGINYTLLILLSLTNASLEYLILPLALFSYFLGCFITTYALESKLKEIIDNIPFPRELRRKLLG